ncbi:MULTISPECIES: carboxy terminal-processing peptidase [unclassified Acinetobacter]|uniref:carboxy terminal-processing peptidase n=1 Tax=unclassified Acinetobacter TaxID=196816 RepID=UPI0035B9E899
MKQRYLASAIALSLGIVCWTQTVSATGNSTDTANNTPATENSTNATAKNLVPTREQAIATSQVARLVDHQHYLPMRLDANTSQRVLDMYLNNLDSDRILFLQSDVDALKAKYGNDFGVRLKTGDLSAAYQIHALYRERIRAYYNFMLTELNKPQDLNQKNTYINTDREKSPYFTNEKAQQDYWRQSVVSQLIGLTISKQQEDAKQRALKENPALAEGQDLTPSEDLTPAQTLKKRYQRRLERIERLKSDDILESTLNALLATYDPHSNYYPPTDAMELNRQTSLQLEGIGVSIRPERGNEDYTRIESIVEGGPASKTGQVRTGDRIIGVAQDGEPMQDVIGWTTQEIVGAIRGKRGTKVTVKLLPAGASANQAKLVTITRDVIQEADDGLRFRTIDVERQGKKQKIGVIEIPSFYLNYRARRDGESYRSVSIDTAKALLTLKQQNVDGIVIDLRNNPGGSLEEVVKMIGQVIKSGPAVQIRDGNGQVTVLNAPADGQQLYDGPLAVMINLASASASEIYSAAIQDYGRGIVIGSTTTGKGTAQAQRDDLAYGQLTLTQRKFYRVTGGSTQNKGVVPDIKLIDIYFDQFGERKSKNPLKWDTIATAPFQRANDLRGYFNQLQKRSDERRNTNPQFKYLSQYVTLNKSVADEKRAVLDLNQRIERLNSIEQQTLAAENQRRKATGLEPYANWESYQAAVEARNEARAKLRPAQRPQLPEEEAFVTESAHILLDMIDLQSGKKLGN